MLSTTPNPSALLTGAADAVADAASSAKEHVTSLAADALRQKKAPARGLKRWLVPLGLAAMAAAVAMWVFRKRSDRDDSAPAAVNAPVRMSVGDAAPDE